MSISFKYIMKRAAENNLQLKIVFMKAKVTDHFQKVDLVNVAVGRSCHQPVLPRVHYY